jgi:hypothetical protein
MATTWEFFYTVETYQDLKNDYNDTNYEEGYTVLVDEFTSGNQDYVIKMHNEYRPSESGVQQDTNGFYIKPVIQTGPYRTYSKVIVGADIINYVRFYMQKKENGIPQETYWLPKDVLSDVKVVKSAGNENMIDLGDVIHIKSNRANATTGAPETSGAPSKYPGVKVNSQGGMAYKFRTTFNKNGAGKSFAPPFTMSAKIKPENFRYPTGEVGTIINANSNVVTITTCAGVNPSITVTKAKLPAEMPATIKAWSMTGVIVEGYPGIPSSSAATVVYDFCGEDGTGKNPRWIGVKTQGLAAPNHDKYLYTIVTCKPGSDTTLTTVFKPGIEKQQKGGAVINSVRYGTNVDKWRKIQYEAVLGNCTTKAITQQDEDQDVMKPPAETQLPTADGRWNPPPHRVTSTEAFGVRMSTLYSELLGVNLNSQARYEFESTNPLLKLDEQANRGRYTRFEKVRIFQDAYGAKSLNRTYKKAAKTVSGTAGNNSIWGFRAIYNPTTFSYSTAANTDVDWTLGAKDPAILLAGNQTVSFDLYLNRIADMSVVRPAKLGAGPIDYTAAMYPRPLDAEEVNGLYHRGTEYDLEYLYRVITGDPEDKNLLLSPKYRALGGKTADLGYTTAVPCWLYLNENMRYYGSVASIQVNHVMFDLRMVPMLTVVTITFARYPASDQGADPKTLREQQQGIAKDTKGKDD